MTVSASDREAALAPLLMKLRARDRITPEEEKILGDSISEIRELPPGKTIVPAGVDVHQCTLLIEGIVCRYSDLADGQRQIMELHVGGDFLDLHSFLLKQLEHNVASMTPVRLAFVPHSAMKKVTEEQPHLTRMLWFSTLLDAAIHREAILSMGRRSALSRLAHLMCELEVRMELIGRATRAGYSLDLTQAELADCTGLTSIHVNRMLKKLRDDGLMTFRSGEVVIHDWDRLTKVAEFDPTYLYLEQRER
ncbi:MAG TPA: Crp/Fnr family transcriptional regulator [Allosphingosinicella sp.]